MKLGILIAIIAAVLLFVLTKRLSAETGSPKCVSQKGELQAGQVWSYKTRAQDNGSTLLVLRVEEYPKIGKVVHVRINDVTIQTPAGGTVMTLPHSPFSCSAVIPSLVKLLKVESPLPDFEEGYKTWKEAFNSGHAGVFTISPGESVDVMQRALSRSDLSAPKEGESLKREVTVPIQEPPARTEK